MLNLKTKRWVIVLAPLAWLACLIGGAPGTAIPAARPVDFVVETATPTPNPALETRPAVPGQPEAAQVLPLGDAPTHTPDPNAPTPVPLPPTITPLPPTLGSPAVMLSSSPLDVTPTLPRAPRATEPPDPPLQGEDWDFETDFIPWPNPYGEPCPGAAVASGWTAFVEDGPYGSSCMNENLYAPNVLSGVKSQEMTFDFISANSGIFRIIQTKPGHRYQITAHAKNDHSLSPVEMALGIDLTGGSDWIGETVQWFAWDNSGEDTWLVTEEVVTAAGDTMTIFIKGFHPMAEQGGKTVIDNVSVIDLGSS